MASDPVEYLIQNVKYQYAPVRYVSLTKKN